MRHKINELVEFFGFAQPGFAPFLLRALTLLRLTAAIAAFAAVAATAHAAEIISAQRGTEAVLESVETTQVYMHADLRLKEKALARIAAPASQPGRYRPDDTLLAFLEDL